MPVNITPLSDEVIARGIQAPDYSKGFDNFFLGQQQAQQQAAQNLFSGGLDAFRDANGQIDWGKAGEALLRIKGPEAIPTLIQLQNLQARRGLPSIESLDQPQPQRLSQPQPPPQRPEPAPVSLSRTTLPANQEQPIVADGERLRPGDPENLTGADRQVTGVSVDGQPTEELFPSRPVATVPAGSAGAMEAPRFAPTPTNAPPADRFADHPVPQRVAQAQVQRQPQPQPQGEQPQGNYGEAEAVRQEKIAARALQASKDAADAGAEGEAKVYLERAKQAAANAKDIRERRGKIDEEREKSRLKQENILPEAVTKAQVDQIVESNKQAKTLQEAVPTTQNLFNQLNAKSGLFSGAWAQEKLQLAKIAASVGFSADPRITPTETYQAEIGRRVGKTVKLFGSGTSITNQDREYAEKMEGGQIKLDENSMRRILELADRGARDTIREHNAKLDTMMKAYPPQYRGQLELFRVQEPPPITGRTTGAKAPPPGALPPAPMSDEDRTNGQLYRTPNGVKRWNRTTAGTGWTNP